MEISNGLSRSPRLGHGVAATWADVVLEAGYGSWSIVGANACKARHARKNHRPWRSCMFEILGPESRGCPIACFEDDSGTARAPALQVNTPTAANIDQASKNAGPSS
jgi:hypothetical protein